eukprot:scaffold53436_cov60-Phaeocystis_antarctica.AAC.1
MAVRFVHAHMQGLAEHTPGRSVHMGGTICPMWSGWYPGCACGRGATAGRPAPGGDNAAQESTSEELHCCTPHLLPTTLSYPYGIGDVHVRRRVGVGEG